MDEKLLIYFDYFRGLNSGDSDKINLCRAIQKTEVTDLKNALKKAAYLIQEGFLNQPIPNYEVEVLKNS